MSFQDSSALTTIIQFPSTAAKSPVNEPRSEILSRDDRPARYTRAADREIINLEREIEIEIERERERERMKY